MVRRSTQAIGAEVAEHGTEDDKVPHVDAWMPAWVEGRSRVQVGLFVPSHI